jgi:2-polyprenyl-6-methoxyphenol hydroxylase-like FAD-dependent oxidoreductase
MVYHRAGHNQHIIARSVLYNLLLRQVPTNKVHFNKRVLDIGEKDDKVFLRTSDNDCYEGDILIGADGAYSAVRQRMYESLKQKGQIPKSDLEELPFRYTCLVGQTEVLDPEEFPQLKEPISQFWSVLGENKPYSVSFCLFLYELYS